MRWLIPAGTAVWALWRWFQEQEYHRQRERDEMVALYFHPFLSACEDLQSRIYHLLELNGFRNLRTRYPKGTYAEETLYLIVRFFGWLATVLRYGPFLQDPEMIRLTEAVRNAFADVRYPIGPFAFFRPEQKALGKLIMLRFEGQHGKELDTISFYEFENRLEHPPLCESEAIRQSLEALRSAKSPKTLGGRERLAEVQNAMVELLDYGEKLVGFTLFVGTRKRCKLLKPPKALER